MVRNDVHDYLEVLLMSLLYICPEEVVVAEACIDMVIIGAGITVIGGHRKVVFDKRCTPDRGGTEVADIIEIVDDTLDVSAMASERLAAVCLVRHSFHRVVRRVAVCEAVRHDKINHVCGSEACTLRRTFPAGSDLIRIFERLTVLREYDVICARPGICSYLHIDKKVVRTVSLADLLH